MEEPVRTDERGHLANSAMEDAHWADDTTIEIKLREGIVFQDGTRFGAGNFERAFVETQKWKAPHPPGTYLNFYPETELEVVDGHTVRMKFPVADGLVLGKFRGFHLPDDKFWDELGFGYQTLGTGGVAQRPQDVHRCLLHEPGFSFPAPSRTRGGTGFGAWPKASAGEGRYYRP